MYSVELYTILVYLPASLTLDMGLMVEKFAVAAWLKNSWSTATMKLVVAVAVDSPGCWSGEFPRAVSCVCKSIRMRVPSTSIRRGVYRLPHTISAVPVCPQSCEPIHSRSLQDSAGGDKGKRKRNTRHFHNHRRFLLLDILYGSGSSHSSFFGSGLQSEHIAIWVSRRRIHKYMTCTL